MAEEAGGSRPREEDTVDHLSEVVARSGREVAFTSHDPQERIAELEAALRAAEQRQAELSSTVCELENRVSTVVAYAQSGERTIGKLIAAVIDRDDRVKALERGFAQRVRRLAASRLRPPAVRVARASYHLLVPRDVRERAWAQRHPYYTETSASLTSLDEITASESPAQDSHDGTSPHLRVAIVTRNAVHGGVETMVSLHQKRFGATVFVAGGLNRPDTCPFEYTYIDAGSMAHARRRLSDCLHPFDVVLYHFLPEWAQAAVRDADRPSIEVVHREDTSDNDKTLPTVIATHSQYLADFIEHEFGREALVIPHAIDLNRFPEGATGHFVGGITSYYPYKGTDLVLEAWARIQDEFPDVRIRYYGAGTERDQLVNTAERLNLRRVELLGPVSCPERHIREFGLVVQASRSEGLPFALLEALASNVPVITSDVDGMVEVNAHAASNGYPQPFILFRSEDVDDLADKLATFLRRHEPAVETRSYIREFYGVERHLELCWKAIVRAVELHAGRGNTSVSNARALLALYPTTYDLRSTPCE